MVVVDEVGLITCDRIVLGQSAQLLIGLLIEPTHMEDDDEEQENEKEDERDGEVCRVAGRRVSRQQQHADDAWMTCARHCEPMSRATLKRVYAARTCDV